ncbi:MAG: adenylate/guanylate cyclase domain-containing protein [Actinomycetota bacterium]
MEVPDVSYARSGDVSIAYQIVGDGPTNLVFVRALSGDLLSTWDQPRLVRHIEGLASSARLLMLDKRGTGLSDRVRDLPTLETRMDDVRAVLDDAGAERTLFFTGHEGSQLALLFAATYPERTAGLMLIEPWVKGTGSAEYPWAPNEEQWRRRLVEVREGWGRREYLEERLREQAPEAADDERFKEWYVTHMRRSLSPGAALSFFRMLMEADVSDVLPAVRVPTLIFHRTRELEPAMYVAERMPHAELCELSGLQGIFTWVNDDVHEVTQREIARFVAQLQRAPESDRVLATILFTDIVGSTERAAELGDQAWRDLLERHHSAVRRRLVQFRGEELDTAGDGFFASFDGPGRAIECARAIIEDVRSLGLDIRAGVHTGECERFGEKLSGIAVPAGARVAAQASPGEILVSGTVKDLVAGSGIGFEDRGEHELKGVPGEWRLYAVSSA